MYCKRHKYEWVAFSKCSVDHYTYDTFKCKKCGKTEIRNKKYYSVGDEGGLIP